MSDATDGAPLPPGPREAVARAGTDVDGWAVDGIYLSWADDFLAALRRVGWDVVRRPMWQPIESAPKDGSDILVCNASLDGGFQQVVSFDDEAVNEWCWATSDGPTFHYAAFTHWMPVPVPPEPIVKPEGPK